MTTKSRTHSLNGSPSRRATKPARLAKAGPSPQERRKVSVVIPALNEARTIERVVRFARRDKRVGEVIVVDDGSIDGTPELAAKAGARVISSAILGKGSSMEDGMQAARYECLLYLDGDMRGLQKDLVEKMTQPIISGEADFVKAKFGRSGGRVTILTARPLLRTYFPELSHFSQPLGGIVAARRSLLRQLRFENDYGVDVGLLIDAAAARARLLEVDIGRIEHDSQDLEALGEMATQVARTILERAAGWGRLRLRTLRAAKERDRLRKADLRHSMAMLRNTERLAIFDMDGTLLAGRFVMELARHAGKLDQLRPLLDNAEIDPVTRTKRIAELFVGLRESEFEAVAKAVPLMPGAVETVIALRRAGYLVGVVTDSYRLAAETVRRRVYADFTVSHIGRFRNDIATGRISLSPAMQRSNGCRRHKVCKLNVMRNLLDELNIGVENVLAVGDGENDVCLLREAGVSIAFQPKTAAVRAAARHVVEDDLREILPILGLSAAPRNEVFDSLMLP